MAKFGKYGALAGAGQGIMEIARNVQDEQRAERMAAIDEAREKRLLDYKAEIDARAREQSGNIEEGLIGTRGDETRATAEHGAGLERGLIGVRGDVQTGLQEDAQEHQISERREEQDWRSSEARLDRESRERIAAQSSASAAAIEARERFERTTFTQTSTNAQGLPVEAEVPAIYDKQTRQYFVQEGTRYVPPGGGEIRLPEDETGAVNFLLENPQYAINFIEKYGYLPSQYIQSLPSQRQ